MRQDQLDAWMYALAGWVKDGKIVHPLSTELTDKLQKYHYKEKNMVDLSKANAGDTVKFRSGGSAKISCIYRRNPSHCDILFEGYDAAGKMTYPNEGSIFEHRHPMDILDVIAKPFDWDNVKPGMSFKDYTGQEIWYMAQDPFSRAHIIVATDFNSGNPTSVTLSMKQLCRRNPDRDVKVKS